MTDDTWLGVSALFSLGSDPRPCLPPPWHASQALSFVIPCSYALNIYSGIFLGASGPDLSKCKIANVLPYAPRDDASNEVRA